ncbi:MAG: iron-sulfur cluster assembly scaffold protein [Aestuariivita sp.]|nr:iron-sulfur cluster assembly scaffold protein [Aestuariivita sp.]
MSSKNDLLKLYSSRILALATELPPPSRLEAPDATVKKRSPLCGSIVTVDIAIEDGKVMGFAQDVKACALGQAAASVVGKVILGRSLDELLATRTALLAMLKSDGPAPQAPFDEMEVLRPAKDFKNRHDSIMLSIEAVTEAMQKADQKKGYA